MKNVEIMAGPAQKPNSLEEQNTRTLMQTLCGCRKNCRECREEAEWEPKIIQAEHKLWKKEVKHE